MRFLQRWVEAHQDSDDPITHGLYAKPPCELPLSRKDSLTWPAVLDIVKLGSRVIVGHSNSSNKVSALQKEATMPGDPNTPASPRILICEHQTQLAEHLAQTLRNLDYEMAGMVTMGEEAVRVAEEADPVALVELQNKMEKALYDR